MALVTANQFQLVPELSRLGSGFQQGQQIRAGLDARQLAQQQAQQTAQSKQFAGQALTGDKAALGGLAGVDTQKAIQIQSFLANQSEADRAEGLRENEVLTRSALSALSIEDPTQRRSFVTAEREKFAAAGRDTANIDRALSGDDNALNQALTLQAQQGQAIADLADRQFPKAAVSSEQRSFDSLIGSMSPEDQVKARRIKAGLDPRAGSSSAERIALNQKLADLVAKTQSKIAGAKTGASEEAKLKQQLNFKPQIAKAVADAKSEAAERNEVLTDLSRAQAAMPGLLNAVEQLRDLSKMATSTLGGRIFDTAVKETGFGSTKGATAKAKFIAIINNQVLPLLKPTFGAAFTVQEGESLKATMGDPNASPEEKMAQLDAFIDQKIRDIETKQLQLGQGEPDQTDNLSQSELNELAALEAQFGGQ
jgi:hypothetical protein